MEFRYLRGAALYLAAAMLAPVGAPAASLTTLYNLPGSSDGLAPFAGLIKSGSLFYGTTEFGGKYGRGAVFSFNPATGAEAVVYSFKSGADGAYPQAGLLAEGGVLYGTTAGGGTGGYGTVFSIAISSGAESVLYSFTAAAGSGSGATLIKVGKLLYGTAYSGGAAGFGSVFSIDPTSGAETTLYSFAGGTADGAYPQAGLAAIGTTLYGTATGGGASGAGTVFSVDSRKGTETTLYSFTGGADGGQPYGALLNVGGTLYGTALSGGGGTSPYGGTVFAIDAATSAETTVYQFSGSAGCFPQAGLTSSGSLLYGTTSSCGTDDSGTVFSLNAATGAETTLYAFPGGSGGGYPLGTLLVSGGVLYGTTEGGSGVGDQGTLFSIKLANGLVTTLHHFAGGNPFVQATSGLVDVSGTLYGATADGGSATVGSVFAVTASTGSGKTLYSFAGGDDGVQPGNGALLSLSGSLYGATAAGGPDQAGTLFKIAPSTGAESAVYSFTGGADGGGPNAPLIDASGTIYGTTAYGGSGYGTIFGVNAKTGELSTLYAFAGGTDGANPEAGLVASGGMLYGTTGYGGASSAGTVFVFNPTTGTETTLYSFTGGTDGLYPLTSLTVSGGNLYGVTNYGGIASQTCYGIGCGVVFKVNIATGAETTLYSFTGGTDGAFPEAALLASGKTLYGTTSLGGAAGGGTVFSLTTTKPALTTLYGFTGGSDGNAPHGALVSSGGIFYGTTSSGGGAGTGTVFSLTP